MLPCMIEDEVQLKLIGREAETLVQEILDEIPTYMLNVEGVRKRPGAAAEELTALPPNCRKEQKFDLLVLQGDRAVGFVDLIKDFPRPGVIMLGLLAIRESAQKKSLGKAAYQAVERYVIDQLGASKIRIGVNDTNPVRVFWEKMGFRATGETKPYHGVAKFSTVFVLEKTL